MVVRLTATFESDILKNIGVEEKVNYLVKLTQILAISAIIAGVIGMLVSNFSIRSLNTHALEPLGHLRIIKESLQENVLLKANYISEGRTTDYTTISKGLIVEKEKVIDEWNAYKNTDLSKEEIRLLPETQKYVTLSLESINALIQLVERKELMGIISWTTDDAPYTISALIPVLNKLMQIEIMGAQKIYSTTQVQFFTILALIIFISIIGYWYIRKVLKRVVQDLTLPLLELLRQSETLAKQKLEEPFIWDREDEIGKVGQSLEISRIALNESFLKIQVQNQELLQKSKLAQMGEMISMIAHQWRQPLGAIASTTVNMKIKLEMESFDLSTVDGRNALNRYFVQRLDKIEEYVRNLTTTIDDFRNFYRPDKQLVRCSLKDVVKKALKIIRDSMEVDSIVIIEDYMDEIKFEMYDNEMTQVILNLLKNAQDNFKEKGIEKPMVRVQVEEHSLKVCDNGGGIPEDIIDKIFEPYFSTKDEKNGTGLGLHMSRVIVEEHHGGKLHVKNYDDGVCFEIKFRNEE